MSSTVPSRIQWSDILNESVYTSDDDVDIGDVAKGEKIGYTDTPAQTEEHIIYIYATRATINSRTRKS
jgi:hypothetical protein